MSKSNYLENAILDHMLGGPNYTRPATVYVSLHTADVTDAGTGTELAGDGYARIAVANDLVTWTSASGGSKSNAIVITTPVATGNWASATHFGIWDASSGGNLMRHGALAAARAVKAGGYGEFAVGDLITTET